MRRVRACASRHPRVRTSAACAAILGATTSAPAQASPWLVQPSVFVSSEHQSNAPFDPERARATTQVGVGFALPAEWQHRRYGVRIDPSVQLRRSRGDVASDTSDASVSAAVARNGERATLAARFGYVQRDLLGVGSPDVGLARVGGNESTWSAGASVSWRASEKDTVAVELDGKQRRYDADEPALVGSDDRTASLSYSRVLTPRVQALVAVGGSEFLPANDAGSSRSVSAQAGFAWQLNELWSARSTYGRSRLRSRFTGLSVPGTVYQAALTRRTETGDLTISADQQFQSSAFGTVVKRRDLAIAYSAPITERLSGSVALRRSDENEAFSGLRFSERRTAEAIGSVSWAVSELWSVNLTAGWRRAEYPATAFSRESRSADSWTGALGLGRRFGTVSLFR